MAPYLLLLALAASPDAANQTVERAEPIPSVEGVWRTEEGAAEVEIFPCGPSICGRVVTSRSIRRDPDLRDKKNHDPDLRSRPVKGMTIFGGFRGGPWEWRGGSLYNPDDGGTYRGVIRLVDEATLKVTGCIIWPLCKSATLHRVSP